MADRLKIYACSGIGDTQEAGSSFTYWTDNTNSLYNTQAVNLLLSRINLCLSDLENLNLSKKEQINKLNLIDFYVVCLHAAQEYRKHYSILEKAGGVISAMWESGMFDSQSLNNDERDKNLDDLIMLLDERMAIDETYNMTDKFAKWWADEVVALNKVGLSASEAQAVESALEQGVSGIGELDWRDNKELANYLTKGGTYFLYTYMTDAQLKQLPFTNKSAISKKKKEQLKTYNYCKSLFVGIYGTETAMQNIIRSGIQADFKDTPENVCASIASGEKKIEGIGVIIPPVVLAAIVTGVFSLLIAVISAICTAVAKSKADEHAAIDEKAIKASCPNASDYDGIDWGGNSNKNGGNGTNTASLSGILKYVLLGTGLMFVLKKFN